MTRFGPLRGAVVIVEGLFLHTPAHRRVDLPTSDRATFVVTNA